MIRKFLTFPRRTPALPACVPAGRRVYAIGDVHGCIEQLDDLLARIAADDAARGPAETTIIFLGDLVDRGPASAAVLSRVAALIAKGGDVRLIRGNHEEVFAAALAGSERAVRAFCRIGGRETILSYGVTPEDYEAMGYGAVGELLAAIVPAAHRQLLDDAEDMIVVGDYLFVHAGIRPDVALNAQTGADLRWIREPFLSHRRPSDKVVVHGHTIAAEVEDTGARIGVDTGAYQGGVLSAIGLEAADRWILGTRREA